MNEVMNDGAVSLNNSGSEDGITGSEPEVTNKDDEAIPLRGEELTKATDSLPTGGAQEQRGMSEEQPLVQHEGVSMATIGQHETSEEQSLLQHEWVSMARTQSLGEPPEVVVEE
ncbi:hypothetical protein V6N11_013010 [Hibiscus sabdariffa]|uniref:Uncharacterized protein n=2 Tax=Hibiscus sabdariffa TaxID=183260 RepID=A0ABR2AUI9_9ROSI